MAYSSVYNNIYSMVEVREQTVNAGTGNFVTLKKYIPGSLRVFVDGTLVHPLRITETGAMAFTVAPPTPGGTSRVLTIYNPLS